MFQSRRIILLALLALVSFYFLVVSLDSANYYKSQYYYPQLLNSEASEKLVDKVYIFLIDGLRYDHVNSEQMNYLSTIIHSEQGAFYKMIVEQPSYSRVAYQVIFTGARPEVNGYLQNAKAEKSLLPNIFGLARANNLKTGASAYHWFSELYNGTPYIHSRDSIQLDLDKDIQYGIFYNSNYYKDKSVFSNAMKIDEEFGPNLLLIHPMETDMAGHDFGGDSRFYIKTIKLVDERIKEMIQKIDLDNSLVIITGDHGHRNKGGHGGDEREVLEVPFIMMGSSIKGGVYDRTLKAVDIAPTISFLLGLPFTPYMEGLIIEDCMLLDKTIVNHKKSLQYNARFSFLHSYSKHLKGNHTPNPSIKSSRAGLEIELYNIRKEVVERLVKGRIALVGFLFLSALIISIRYRKALIATREDGILVLLYFFIFYGMFYLFNYDYSYSTINKVGDFFTSVPIITGISVAIVYTFSLIIKYLGNVTRGYSLTRFIYLVIIARIVMTMFLYTQVGSKITNFVPNLRYLVAYFTTLYELSILSIIAASVVFIEKYIIVMLRSKNKELNN